MKTKKNREKQIKKFIQHVIHAMLEPSPLYKAEELQKIKKLGKSLGAYCDIRIVIVWSKDLRSNIEYERDVPPYSGFEFRVYDGKKVVLNKVHVYKVEEKEKEND